MLAAYFIAPVMVLPWPFWPLQAVPPLLWLAAVALVSRRYEARGIWVVVTAPLAMFGWNVVGAMALFAACAHAQSC
jgi:hypothetical protein